MADVKTTLKTVWNGNAKGNGTIKAPYLETDLAIPVALGRNEEGSEPKEMLITSATACFTMTVTGMLQMKKFPVDQTLVDTESTNSKKKALKSTILVILFYLLTQQMSKFKLLIQSSDLLIKAT